MVRHRQAGEGGVRMEIQTLHFFETKTKPVSFDEPDTFRFRPERGWKPLQKLCCFILSKIGAINTRIEESIQRIDIREKDFMTAFMRQHNEIMKRCQYTPERVYMGREDFCEFASLPEFKYSAPVSFKARHEVWYMSERFIIGLPITVIPWMKGVLIVPKERP